MPCRAVRTRTPAPSSSRRRPRYASGSSSRELAGGEHLLLRVVHVVAGTKTAIAFERRWHRASASSAKRNEADLAALVDPPKPRAVGEELRWYASGRRLVVGRPSAPRRTPAPSSTTGTLLGAFDDPERHAAALPYARQRGAAHGTRRKPAFDLRTMSTPGEVLGRDGSPSCCCQGRAPRRWSTRPLPSRSGRWWWIQRSALAPQRAQRLANSPEDDRLSVFTAEDVPEATRGPVVAASGTGDIVASRLSVPGSGAPAPFSAVGLPVAGVGGGTFWRLLVAPPAHAVGRMALLLRAARNALVLVDAPPLRRRLAQLQRPVAFIASGSNARRASRARSRGDGRHLHTTSTHHIERTIDGSSRSPRPSRATLPSSQLEACCGRPEIHDDRVRRTVARLYEDVDRAGAAPAEGHRPARCWLERSLHLQPAMGTGLREHELLALDVGDVFDDAGRINAVSPCAFGRIHARSHVAREVLLFDTVRAKLERLLLTRKARARPSRPPRRSSEPLPD